MSMRPLAAIAVLAALSLGAAACGSSSSSSSSGASTGAGSSLPQVSSGGSSQSLAGGSGFCSDAKGKLRSLQSSIAQMATSGSQKEQLKNEMQAWTTFANAAKASAPSQIKGDVTVIADFLQHLSNAYAQAGYDPIKAAAVIGPYLQQNQAKLQAASNHIQTWAQTNCGL
jgi:hypothetical protein